MVIHNIFKVRITRLGREIDEGHTAGKKQSQGYNPSVSGSKACVFFVFFLFVCLFLIHSLTKGHLDYFQVWKMFWGFQKIIL